MALKGKADSGQGGDYEMLDADTYDARLVSIIDIGKHSTTFGDKRQVVLVWELVGPTMQNGKPWYVCRRYTLSFNEKAALRKDLEAFRRAPYGEGADIDVTKFLGSPWSVEISHTTKGEKTYYGIGKVGPVPKAREKSIGKPVATPFVYDADDHHDYQALQAAEGWLPRVYGEKVLDLVSLGRRNLNVEANGDGDTPFSHVGADGPAEEDIPF